MAEPLSSAGKELLFTSAHTMIKWQDTPVAESTLRELYDLAKMPPTSANCQPMRVVFLTSDAAKQKLKPALDEGNVEKTLSAPVIALVAYDTVFYDELPRLFPHADARSWFVGDDKKIHETAVRNGSLQGAYFILAARALGLDCGPMSGFDEVQLNDLFFADTTHRINFICNLGYGQPGGHYPRSPRPTFDEFCKIV